MARLSYPDFGNERGFSDLRKRSLGAGKRHGDFEEEYSEYSSLGCQSTRESEPRLLGLRSSILPDGAQEEVQYSMTHSVKTLFPIEPAYWLAPGGNENPGADPFRVCVDDLQEAALRGDVQLILRQIQEGVPVNAPLSVVGGDEFLTLLHILACKPDVPNGAQIVCELIDAKANPNVRSTLGSTPLMFACYHKNVTVAKVLLEADANPDTTDDHGKTASRYAVMLEGNKKLENQRAMSASLLVTLQLHGANLDYGGDRAPITEAVLQDNFLAMTQLLELGVEPLGLVEAIEDKTLTSINELLAARANPFHENEDGLDCMELAIQRNDEDILRALRFHIADLERARHVHLNTKMQAIEQRAREMKVMQREHLGRFPKRRTSMARASYTLQEKFFSLHESQGPTDSWARRQKRKMQRMLKHPVLSWTFTVNLVFALFLPDTWAILGMDSESLNYTLCFILFIFIIEFGMQVFAFRSAYLGKFVFWTDIIGLLSVPLDITWIMNGIVRSFGASEVPGAGVARVTKFVKLGARAGRLSRLVKLLRFVPGLKSQRPGAGQLVTDQQKGTAKGIALELNTKLAMKISIIIIMAVIMIPVLEFWRFPLDDNSQILWATHIDRVAKNYPNEVHVVIDDMRIFYQSRNYFPYQVTYVSQNGTRITESIRGASVPLRIEDIATVGGMNEILVQILFNFRSPNLVEASMTVTMMSSIICVIFIAAGTVSTTVNFHVSTPIDMLLEKVQTVAQQIFQAVEKLATYFVKDHANTNFSAPVGSTDDTDPIFMKEIAFLSRVVKIIGVLYEISVAKTPIDEFEQLSIPQKHLLHDYATPDSKRHDVTLDRLVGELREEQLEAPSLLESIALELEEAELARTEFDNWDLNTIEITSAQRTAIAHCIIMMYDTAPGFNHKVVDIQRYSCHGEFVKAVENAYDDEHVVPYHNWIHAVDVAFTLQNTFRLMHAEKYFNLHERYALMVAALAHDIGHLGTTNAYLIESNHELALMYNDSSCRENMSAAKLFEMTRRPETAIFVHMDPTKYKEVREIIVSAILCTDMAKHFNLMHQLRAYYIQKQVLFQYINDRFQANEQIPEQAAKEVEDYFWNPDVKCTLRNIMVHFADMSNSLKPWEQCFNWAQLMYEEFFKQGDQEREYKLVMQPLNDRVRVNVPFSQIKFVVYFVAPQTCMLASMMPGLSSCKEHLWTNLTHWLEKWKASGADPFELVNLTQEVALLKESSQESPFIIDKALRQKPGH